MDAPTASVLVSIVVALGQLLQAYLLAGVKKAVNGNLAELASAKEELVKALAVSEARNVSLQRNRKSITHAESEPPHGRH